MIAGELPDQMSVAFWLCSVAWSEDESLPLCPQNRKDPFKKENDAFEKRKGYDAPKNSLMLTK